MVQAALLSATKNIIETESFTPKTSKKENFVAQDAGVQGCSKWITTLPKPASKGDIKIRLCRVNENLANDNSGGSSVEQVDETDEILTSHVLHLNLQKWTTNQ